MDRRDQIEWRCDWRSKGSGFEMGDWMADGDREVPV